MRSILTALLFFCFLLIGIISFNSSFEAAPSELNPRARQVMLFTPAGLMKNFVLDPDHLWTEVYNLKAVRAENILHSSILIPYLLIVLLSTTALWYLRKL